MADGHVFDLLWGHQAKLNLLNRLERRARMSEEKVRHDCGFLVRFGER